MKYSTGIITLDNVEKILISVFIESGFSKTFFQDKSNTDYVQFLVDAQLTDSQVKDLKPDTWYDFPEGA